MAVRLCDCGRGQRGRGGGRGAGPARAEADPEGRGLREPCAGRARVAGGSDAQLLGSRAGRRRLRARPSFRGSALHQVRLTQRSPCPSRMSRPAERPVGARSRRPSRLSARVCGGSANSGNPVLQPAPGRELFGSPQRQRPGDSDGLPGSLSPGTARRVSRALSRHRALAEERQGAGPAFSSGRGGAAHWPEGPGARGSSQWELWLHLTHGRGGARGRGRARESAGDWGHVPCVPVATTSRSAASGEDTPDCLGPRAQQ